MRYAEPVFLRFYMTALLVVGGVVPLLAQNPVRVVIDEVTDNRMSEGEGEWQMRGSLDVEVKLVGDGLDGAVAARVLVKAAKDDQGNSLFTSTDKLPDFQARDMNMGMLKVALQNPSRAATTFGLSGTLELFVPKRDPGAVVKVEKALSKPDKPLQSKGLKAAKIDVTVLSTARYKAEQEKQKLDDKKIAEIRAEGKRRGETEADIDAVIELAKAFQELGGSDVPEGAVILFGNSAALDRIQKIRILQGGEEISVNSSSSSSDGTTTTIVLQPETVPGPLAALEFTILTQKARVSVPFDLKDVPLP